MEKKKKKTRREKRRFEGDAADQNSEDGERKSHELHRVRREREREGGGRLPRKRMPEMV